jgi:hypothetical protein
MTGKYRPPNGAEGDYFMERFCEQCTKDDVENNILCPIIAATYAFDVDDPHYPDEWQYYEGGLLTQPNAYRHACQCR